jgi:hypothetical protein
MDQPIEGLVIGTIHLARSVGEKPVDHTDVVG